MKLKVNYTDKGKKIVDSMFYLNEYDGRHTIQGKILDVLVSMKKPSSAKSDIKVVSMMDEELVLEATGVGYSILRLAFYQPYYTIEEIEV